MARPTSRHVRIENGLCAGRLLTRFLFALRGELAYTLIYAGLEHQKIVAPLNAVADLRPPNVFCRPEQSTQAR